MELSGLKKYVFDNINYDEIIHLYPSRVILSTEHEFSILPIKICDTSYKDFERGKV